MLTDALVRNSGFSPLLDTTDGYYRFELEACDAGITECDALIAQTGSVFLTARSGGGRALSVLPEHHVVLARRDQLFPDLPAGYELNATALHGPASPPSSPAPAAPATSSASSSSAPTARRSSRSFSSAETYLKKR